MEIKELKEKTQKRFLLEGESGRGKTYQTCKVVLRVLDKGGSVLYVDTETEGSGTLLDVIDDEGYDEDVVEDLDYVRTEGYSDLMKQLDRSEDFDLMVIDTIDHKHSYVLKHVTDAKRDGDADWNEYPQIYGEEKEVMRAVTDVSTNIIATLDPDSGSRDKPKGAQTNIRGYFTAVIRLKKKGEQDWSHKIINWQGESDWIGKKHPEFPDPIVNEVKEEADIDN